MKITEITSEKDATVWLDDAVGRSTSSPDQILEHLIAAIEKWAKEFDLLQKEIKRRDKDNINHKKLNKITGLYFLIPAAIKYQETLKNPILNSYKDDRINLDMDTGNWGTWIQEHPEEQRMWNKDSLFLPDPDEPNE